MKKKMKIGVYVEEQVRRGGAGAYDAAIVLALERFTEIKSKTVVTDAHRYLRDYLAWYPRHFEKFRSAEDLFAHLKDTYSGH